MTPNTRKRRSSGRKSPKNANTSPLKKAAQVTNVLRALTNTSPGGFLSEDENKAGKAPLPPAVDAPSRSGSSDSEDPKENVVVPQLKEKQEEKTSGVQTRSSNTTATKRRLSEGSTSKDNAETPTYKRDTKIRRLSEHHTDLDTSSENDAEKKGSSDGEKSATKFKRRSDKITLPKKRGRPPKDSTNSPDASEDNVTPPQQQKKKDRRLSEPVPQRTPSARKSKEEAKKRLSSIPKELKDNAKSPSNRHKTPTKSDRLSAGRDQPTTPKSSQKKASNSKAVKSPSIRQKTPARRASSTTPKSPKKKATSLKAINEKPDEEKIEDLKKRRRSRGIFNNPEDFDMNQGRATGNERVVGMSAEEKEEIRKALEETQIDARVKGYDNSCADEGEEVGTYFVQRIMRVNGDDSNSFLVAWQGWNFTGCTWQSLNDVEGSPIALREYVDKEKGLAAVMKHVEQDRNQFNADIKFVRFHVPFMKNWITDEELEEKMKIPSYRQKIGYWRLKMIELEWLRVLDPKANFDQAPVYIENWVDAKFAAEALPKFQFVSKLQFTRNAAKMIKEMDSNCHKGCTCQVKGLCDECLLPDDCLFCDITADGLIVDPKSDDMSTLGMARAVVSCGKDCSCIAPHRRQIPAIPRQRPLVVFLDPVKGWSVRALMDMKKGELVSEYLGQVMTDDEADGLDESYNFCIGQSLVVNASQFGNEARFFCHSCDPNMVVVRVYDRGTGEPETFHRMVMVTARDIKAGEELTFDYHPDSKTRMEGDPRPHNKPRNGYSTCKCASAICRQWL